VDETYSKVHGKWCYLYRAIDHDGNLVDSMVSENRNMEAAQQFLKRAIAVVGHVPDQVTTDGHTSYPRAIHEIMGSDILHRKNKYLNNRLGQDHRGIKQRYYPCAALEQLRQQLDSVALLTNYATISVLAAEWAKQSPS
jgi:putative transposase